MSSLAIRACRSRHCSADVLLRRSNPASLAFFVFPGRVDPAPSKKFPAGLVGSTDQLVFYVQPPTIGGQRSEEHTSELQSLMRISYAVFCLKKKKKYYLQSPQRQA